MLESHDRALLSSAQFLAELGCQPRDPHIDVLARAGRRCARVITSLVSIAGAIGQQLNALAPGTDK